MSRLIITQPELKEILHYNQETGIFTWFCITSNRVKINDIAGCLHPTGYIIISAKGRKYLAHRLVFLYMEGELPPDQVDHINHNRSDNRWANLRHATSLENHRNTSRSKANKSGVTGVLWDKKANKWRARIVVNKKEIHLGRFREIRDAILSRKSAEIKYRFHANHGRI